MEPDRDESLIEVAYDDAPDDVVDKIDRFLAKRFGIRIAFERGSNDGSVLYRVTRETGDEASVDEASVVVPAFGRRRVQEAIESAASRVLTRLDLGGRHEASLIGDESVEELSLMHGCPIHAGVVHGEEADRLRRGIEQILGGLDVNSVGEEVIESLSGLLDEVDAGDSLAHGERVGSDRGACAGERELRRKVEEMQRGLCDIGWSVNCMTEEEMGDKASIDVARVVSAVCSYVDKIGSSVSRVGDFEGALRDIGEVVGLRCWKEEDEAIDARKVVAEVRSQIGELRSLVERLDRDGQVAWLASALVGATSRSSTAKSRQDLRRVLVEWGGGRLGRSVFEILESVQSSVRSDRMEESVDGLDLGVAASNFLLGNEIRTLGDLVRLTKADLLGMKHGGISVKTSVVKQIIAALADVGLSLASAQISEKAKPRGGRGG